MGAYFAGITSVFKVDKSFMYPVMSNRQLQGHTVALSASLVVNVNVFGVKPAHCLAT